jgi:hypothetical protein
MARIRSQPPDLLRSQTERSFELLRRRLERHRESDGEKLGTLLNDADYINRLSPREMIGLLSLEYLKGFLGKPSAAPDLFTKF